MSSPETPDVIFHLCSKEKGATFRRITLHQQKVDWLVIAFHPLAPMYSKSYLVGTLLEEEREILDSRRLYRARHNGSPVLVMSLQIFDPRFHLSQNAEG